MTLTDSRGHYIQIDGRNGVAKLVAGRADHWTNDTVSRLTNCGGDMDEVVAVASEEGYTECPSSEVPAHFYDRLTDLLAASSQLSVDDEHFAKTGTIYVTIERESDGAKIVVRISDHDECYPPIDGVEQVTLTQWDEESWIRTIKKLNEFANQ